MKEPTGDEIAAEIEKLRTMKLNVQKFSLFGENNHNAIDAQIEVLKDQMSEDDVFRAFSDDDENVLSSARDTAAWLEGESEDGPPSKSWEPLLKP